MTIVVILYVAVVYLIFFKFRLLPWNMISQGLTLLVGVVILMGFLVGLRLLAPASTQAAITGRMVEIAPQVSGRIISIEAQRNVTVQPGTVLYTIDPTRYQARVDELQAALGLSMMRAEQFRELAEARAGSKFQVQEAVATSSQQSAQLAAAMFDLANTKVRAPTKGMIPRLFLKEGMQVSPSKSVLVFVDTEELMVGGLFPQKALQTVKIGDKAMINFAALPGRVFESRVSIIPSAIGDTQLMASGHLPSVQGQYMTRLYPIYVELPEDLPDGLKKIGLAAKVYIHTEGAGVVGQVAVIMQKLASSLDAIL